MLLLKTLGCLVLMLALTTLSLSQTNYKRPKSFNRFRGPQVAGTTLTNINLKSSERVSPRKSTYLTWQAPVSGRIKELFVGFKTDRKRGYSGGTGGSYTISLRPDVYGVPGVKILASVSGIGKFKDNNAKDNFRRIIFKASPKVKRGRYYHFVISNDAPKPLNNWSSINSIFTANRVPRTVKPTFSEAKSFSFHTTTGFEPLIPIWVIDIDTNKDGKVDTFSGNPYIGVFSKYKGINPWSQPISGTKISRMIYPVKSNDRQKVVAINLAAYRTKGSDDLVVDLTSTSGLRLGRAFISAKNFPITASPVGNQAMTWGRGVFNPPVFLDSNNSYFLIFSTKASSVYYPAVLQDSNLLYGGPAKIDGKHGGWFGSSAFAEVSFNAGKNWSQYFLTNSYVPGYKEPSKKWDIAFFTEVSRK